MKRPLTNVLLIILCLTGLLSIPEPAAGQSFPFKATGLPVNGDILHAASGTDFIDVVYSRTAVLYYNRLNISGIWSEEKSLGAGTEARLAIDHLNHPHIVFTSSDKIAYIKYDGNEWSTPEFIISNNAGACSKPDIDLDAAGNAHITYTDTKGNVGNYTDRPDIMYANNTSGIFVKTMIYNGYLEYYGGADRYAEYFDKGSVIDVDIAGNYYILAHKYQYQTWMGGNDKQYSVVVHSNLGTGGTPTKSSDVYAGYDLANTGNTVYALYKETTFKVSELVLSGTPPSLSFVNSIDVTASSVSSLALQGTDVVTGGLTSGKLFTRHNALAHIYDDITVKGTIVPIVGVADAFFSVYTDNADGMIKIREVSEPLSFTRFGFAEQTGPALINGQTGVINLEVASGTVLTNLTATFTTTTDITEVKSGGVTQSSGITINDFSSPVTYVLNDGTTERNWMITVTEKPEVFTLTVETVGTGTVKVNNVIYSGVITANSGTALNLEAVAGEEYTFTGWSGDLISTENPASLNINANKTITANFALTTGYDELRTDNPDVFPNPFTDIIKISNAKNVVRVVISDISGHQVMNIQLNGSQTIPSGNLKRGIYFINIELINGKNILRKMIKQ